MTPVSHHYKPPPSPGGDYDSVDPTFVISVADQEAAIKARFSDSAAGNYEEPVVRLNGMGYTYRKTWGA